jgi:hypothetical protein
MRNSFLPFRQAERILFGQGLKIDRKSYYNLARAKSMEISPEGLLALVAALERDSCTYRTYWDFVYPLVGGDCNHSNSTNQIAVFDLI